MTWASPASRLASTNRSFQRGLQSRVFSAPGYIDIGALSHPGRVRTRNEDCFYVANVERSLQTVMSNLTQGDVPEHTDETNCVMVVADGMGGHNAGDVASRLVISSLVDLALDIPDWIFRADETHAPEIQRRMRESIEQIGALLIERGRQDPALYGMGSTVTIARTCERDLLVTHVGDSRAYLFRGGGLERLTRDDTYAQALVDLGQLAPDDVSDSGVNHILTNALGGSHERVGVATYMLPLRDGDRLLLCSDGLSDCVDDGTIAETLSLDLPAGELCERLLRLALDRGGRDNITIIVAMFGFSSPAALPERPLRGLRAAAARLRETYRPSRAPVSGGQPFWRTRSKASSRLQQHDISCGGYTAGNVG